MDALVFSRGKLEEGEAALSKHQIVSLVERMLLYIIADQLLTRGGTVEPSSPDQILMRVGGQGFFFYSQLTRSRIGIHTISIVHTYGMLVHTCIGTLVRMLCKYLMKTQQYSPRLHSTTRPLLSTVA